MFWKIRFPCLMLLALCLAACAGSATPQLIASYPGDSQGSNQAASPYGFVPTPGPCSTFIEVEVSDLETAVGRVSDLASSYGASISSLQTWTANGRKSTSLTIVVPQTGLYDLRRRLLQLGSPLEDSLLGDPAYSRLVYCQISLTLTQESPRHPSIGWNPILTLKQALCLSVTIFSFVVDALIWIAVVVGPFVLMGLGVRALLRRTSKPQS
jgi:hypothetical protein